MFETSSRKSIYTLKDGFFRFWFRFIPSNLNNLASGRTDEAWKRIEAELPNLLGKPFEELCLQWSIYHHSEMPVSFEEIGRWWGNNPVENQQEEIDLITNAVNTALFMECKYRNNMKIEKVYQDLIRKSQLFKQFPEKRYVFFEKRLIRNGSQRKNCSFRTNVKSRKMKLHILLKFSNHFRGLDEETMTEMIVMRFVEPFTKEL